MATQEGFSYGWMTQPTAHETWVKGSGMIVWLSVAFGLIGSGAYIVSAFLGTFLGMALAWLIVVVLKNFMHLLHAKHISNATKMANRPKTSWISRGTIFTTLFTLFGFFQLIAFFFSVGDAVEVSLRVLTAICAVGIIGYEGFLLSSNKAVPFWNSAMVPVLFFLWAFFGGAVFAQLICSGSVPNGSLNWIIVAFGLALALCLLAFMWNALMQDETAAASARQLATGRDAGIFWLSVVVGAVIPTAATLVLALMGIEPLAVFAAICLCAFFGELSFSYCIFKAGKYKPLI